MGGAISLRSMCAELFGLFTCLLLSVFCDTFDCCLDVAVGAP